VRAVIVTWAQTFRDSLYDIVYAQWNLSIAGTYIFSSKLQ